MHCLVFNDKSISGTFLDEALYQQLGLKIATAHDCAEALLLPEDFTFDLILIHYEAYLSNSIELLQEIKIYPRLSGLPIVVLAVHIGQKMKDALSKSGVGCILEQPLPKEKIVENIRALLQQKPRLDKRIDRKEVGPLGYAVYNQESVRFKIPILDISLGGVFLKLQDPIPDKNVPFKIKLFLSGMQKSLTVQGEVVRVIEKNQKVEGIGVKFFQLNEATKAKIKSFIDSRDQSYLYEAYYL